MTRFIGTYAEALKKPQNIQTENRVFFQDDSLFFILPAELRIQIYDEIFRTSVLTFRETRFRARTQPCKTLALLQSCRRMRYEIDGAWVSKVVFSFNTPFQMVDKLLGLPQGSVADVRYVQVNARSTLLEIPNGEMSIKAAFGLPSMLRFLPGLRLEELTVMGSTNASTNSKVARHLIRMSSGWKTLYFVTNGDWQLRHAYYDADARVGTRLMNWQRQMELRDGASSMPTITIYATGDQTSNPQPGNWGVHRRIKMPPICPGSCKLLEPAPTTPVGDYSLLGYRGPKRETVPGNQMMAVIERGTGADVEQKSEPHAFDFDHPSLPAWARQASWQDVRGLCTSSNEHYMMEAPLPPLELSVIQDHGQPLRELDSGVDVSPFAYWEGSEDDTPWW